VSLKLSSTGGINLTALPFSIGHGNSYLALSSGKFGKKEIDESSKIRPLLGIIAGI
jgi:hypothetical protein